MLGFSASNGWNVRPAHLALALAAGSCLCSAGALAQSAPDAAPLEPESPGPTEPEAPTSVQPERPAAADPPPRATGSLKVEQANGDTVVVEKPTTPVLPDKKLIPQRAYQLQWEIDVPLFAIGAALALGREIRSTNGAPPAYCTTVPEGCDESTLNALDRPFAGYYNPRWSDATDVVVLALFTAPWPMLWVNNTLLNTLNDITIIYESALTALALSGLATLSASRPRPLVYGTKAPEDVRNSPSGSLTFISGHTTGAFALSTSTFWTIYRRHGSGAYAWTTLAVGTALATSVGVGRVMAGKHFPTDVLTGAAVGAAVGTLIPALHDAPVLVVPSVDAAGASVDVSLTL